MISVVVPVYNMEKLIDKCLKSLLNQSVKDYEVILVDDGSTDKSAAICDQYATRYLEFIRVIHKANGGLSSARNAGIEHARGEYVIFPDPDDWLEENYIEAFLSAQEESRADLVCLGYWIECDHKTIPFGLETEVLMDGMQAQRALLISPKMSGFAWNKIYRLDVIRNNGLKFEDDVGTTEDLDFAYRYLKFCNKVYFNPSTRVYHYYQREGAATHSKFSYKKVDSIRAYEKIIKDTHDEVLKHAAEENICNTAINLMWEYYGSSIDDKKCKRIIGDYIKKYAAQYLSSRHYGIGRKAQCMAAVACPQLFYVIKNKVTKG